MLTVAVVLLPGITGLIDVSILPTVVALDTCRGRSHLWKRAGTPLWHSRGQQEKFVCCCCLQNREVHVWTQKQHLLHQILLPSNGIEQ
uniref:Secreted protein n=1 Tax=Arundo donax TaxID=35708 RepID=A0A0A9DN62_ARUDO